MNMLISNLNKTHHMPEDKAAHLAHVMNEDEDDNYTYKAKMSGCMSVIEVFDENKQFVGVM